MIDFNDAPPQRATGELIPNNTIVRVVSKVTAGGANRPDHDDGGMLTASKSSDSTYLSFEFTVVDGPFARRKFWQNMTVTGGEVNEKGESKAWNITRSTIKAMLNSAHGISPDDTSSAAIAKRQIQSFDQLSQLEFVCKVRIVQPKPGSAFQPSNQIAQVIEPGSKEYAAAMGGATAAPSASAPFSRLSPWQQGQTPAPPPQAAAGAPLPAWSR